MNLEKRIGPAWFKYLDNKFYLKNMKLDTESDDRYLIFAIDLSRKFGSDVRSYLEHIYNGIDCLKQVTDELKQIKKAKYDKMQVNPE